jgi:RNA polymerase sigma-70 factor (ECF subfamily)
LLTRTARGDEGAFGSLYDLVSSKVFGLVRRVVRDPAHAEEVTQEVFLQVWRQSGRFDRSHGTAVSWVLTLAHRRAVDRVRSAQAATDRDLRAAQRDVDPPHDQVAEAVEQRLEAEQVRRCLEGLTEIQRESVTLAYYQGLTYAEVGTELGVPLGTIKTRMRDGLVRLRDCMGVTA